MSIMPEETQGEYANEINIYVALIIMKLKMRHVEVSHGYETLDTCVCGHNWGSPDRTLMYHIWYCDVFIQLFH